MALFLYGEIVSSRTTAYGAVIVLKGQLRTLLSWPFLPKAAINLEQGQAVSTSTWIESNFLFCSIVNVSCSSPMALLTLAILILNYNKEVLFSNRTITELHTRRECK